MSLSVDQIKIIVTAETQKAIKGLKGVSDGAKKVNFSFKDVIKGAVGFNAVSLAINVLQTAVRSSIRTIVDFDQAIANAGSVSSVTKKELRELALEAGRNTKFSATQGAEALYFLASAGIDSAEAMRDILTPALRLASASGMGIARTTDIMVNNLAVFRKEGIKASEVADIMAHTVASSNTNFSQLAEALKVVGADATLSGIKFKDLNVAVGAMAEMGQKGSEGAIKMRQALIRLRGGVGSAKKILAKYGLTVEDVDKTIREDGLLEAFKQLRDSGMSTVDMTTMLGGRQGAVVALIKNGLPKYEELQEKIVGVGSAYEDMARKMSEKQMDTITGQVLLMKSAWEDIVLTLSGGGGLTDAFKEILKVFVQVIRKIGEFVRIPAVLTSIKVALNGLIIAFKLVFALFKTTGRIIFLSFQPIITLWEFIGRLVFSVIKGIVNNVKNVVKIFGSLFRAVLGFATPVTEILTNIGKAWKKVYDLYIESFFKAIIAGVQTSIEALTELLQFMVEKLGKYAPQAMVDAVNSLTSASSKTFTNLKKRISWVIKGTMDDFKALGKDVIKTYNDIFGEIKKGIEDTSLDAIDTPQLLGLLKVAKVVRVGAHLRIK